MGESTAEGTCRTQARQEATQGREVGHFQQHTRSCWVLASTRGGHELGWVHDPHQPQCHTKHSTTFSSQIKAIFIFTDLRENIVFKITKVHKHGLKIQNQMKQMGADGWTRKAGSPRTQLWMPGNKRGVGRTVTSKWLWKQY